MVFSYLSLAICIHAVQKYDSQFENFDMKLLIYVSMAWIILCTSLMYSNTFFSLEVTDKENLTDFFKT